MHMPVSLDARPRYAALVEELALRIRQDYRPGDLLPTQSELAKEFDTSLITVKRAINELGRAGLVDSIRGRGTFACRPVIADNHSGISSWTDNIARQGIEPFTAWVKISVRMPSPEMRRLLSLRARERTVVIQRLRTVDGSPICLMTNEIPKRLVPGLAERGLDGESLYACLAERYSIRPGSAEEEVAARPASRSERTALAMTSDIVLEVRRLTKTANGKKMEFSRVIGPADRYQYRVTLNSKAN
jgi:GntR family transcriptional regulator